MPPKKPAPKAAARDAAATQVETLHHPVDITRSNIPTAETSGLMQEAETTAPPKLYPRNPDLDPQLVWHGKDAQDAEPLSVPTVPIYIQDKVLPEVLIRDLQRQARNGTQPQADLFGGFDRIVDQQDKLEFYQHAENWSNRMILGDSLLVMNSLAEKEGLRGQVQCIYLDPPYGIRFVSNWQAGTRSREVKEGKIEGLSREPEQIKAFRDTWKDGIHSYLSYLRDRLLVARELLTGSGSVFVQIGDENVHIVRAVMDEIYGPDNFIGQIVVQKAGSASGIYLPGICDYLIWFGKDKINTNTRTQFALRDVTTDDPDRFTGVLLPDGTRSSLSKEGGLPAGPIYSLPTRCSRLLSGAVRARGRQVGSPSKLREGRFCPPTALDGKPMKLACKGFLGKPADSAGDWHSFHAVPQRFFRDADFEHMDRYRGCPRQGLRCTNSVENRTSLHSHDDDPGDLVLDPTCGSGTTAFVAEQWGRRWITIDTSRVALALARTRLMAARHPAYLLRDSREGAAKEAEIAGRPPPGRPVPSRHPPGLRA